MLQCTKNSLGGKSSMLFRILFYGYTVVLFFLTLIPIEYFRGEGSGWLSFLAFKNSDKLIHFLMFFLMTGLLYVAYRFTKKYWYFTIPVATGIVIELLQHFTDTGRTFDVIDIAANTLGTFGAYFLFTKR